ncbi:MAG: DUF6404 family protein [Planctomycetes bacterium]|nr:DUF6404 family protein [Planctomycetota bacterium]
MTHRQKVDYHIQDMRKKGVGISLVAPPLFRILWAIGLKIPPPLFLGFVPITLITGAMFGAVWGVFMWILQWQASKMAAEIAVLAAAGSGLCFGLFIAAYCRRKARSLGLPAWENYPRES